MKNSSLIYSLAATGFIVVTAAIFILIKVY